MPFRVMIPVFFSLAVMPSKAAAESWYSFNLNVDGQEISVVEFEGATPNSVWVADVSFKNANDLDEEKNQYPVQYSNWRIDCLNKTAELRSIINYRENGSVASQFTPRKEIAIPPSSVAHSLWTIVCDFESLPKGAIFHPIGQSPHAMRREFREAQE